MISPFDSAVLQALTTAVGAHVSDCVANPSLLFKGKKVPALVIAVLPNNSSMSVVYQNLSLLRVMEDRTLTIADPTAPPVAQSVADELVSAVMRSFDAGERFQNAVEVKEVVGRTLQELVFVKLRPAVTVSEKPVAVAPTPLDGNQSVGDESQVDHSAVMKLVPDVWCHVASFLPIDDLLHLPHVGGLFFELRQEIVWWNVYVRCFGAFTPSELRIVAPWDHFDVEVEPNAPESQAAEDTDEPRPFEYVEPNFRTKIYAAILPLLISAKRNFWLHPSPESFFESFAPKGTVTLQSKRMMMVNASPLHLISLLKIAGESAVEVVVEEAPTCRGVVKLISLMVCLRSAPVGQQRVGYASLAPRVKRAIISTVLDASRPVAR